MTCVTCGQEFIESVPDEPQPAQAQAPPSPAPGLNQPFQPMNADPDNPLGSLFNMFSTLLQPQQPNQANPNTQGAQQPPMNPFAALEQQFAQAQRQQQAHQAQGRGPNFVQMQFPMGPVFNFTTDPVSIRDLLGGLMMPQQMGDYVSDAGMAGLLDRLFRQHQSSQVPAGKKVLDKLPIVKFTKETATGECAICKCDWEENDEAVDLPCHHLFHNDCIKKWFETSNLCPMCRHELPTDDPEYEEKRKERQAEQERKDQLRSSQREMSTASPSSPGTSSSPSPVTVDLTQSQQDLLNEVISISSDDDSLDIDEELFSAEEEEETPSVAPRTGSSASSPQNPSHYQDQQSTAPGNLPDDSSMDLD